MNLAEGDADPPAASPADAAEPDPWTELIPWFPNTSFTPLSECPHKGPIRAGSSLCCMVCHKSGKDGTRALPRHVPEPPDTPEYIEAMKAEQAAREAEDAAKKPPPPDKPLIPESDKQRKRREAREAKRRAGRTPEEQASQQAERRTPRAADSAA